MATFTYADFPKEKYSQKKLFRRLRVQILVKMVGTFDLFYAFITSN